MEFTHIVSCMGKNSGNPDLVCKNSGSTEVYIFSLINVDVDQGPVA